MEKIHNKKKWAATLSIISNSTLIFLKVIAGIITGSIGIISEAIHSGSDLLASIITLFSVSESAKPADKDHQFGHGKFEDFTSFLEGLLIILAALYIVYEAVKKIMHASTIEMDVNVGLVVMFISVLANILIGTYLFKVAKETDSIALYADGEHLRTDIYSSLAVFIGLLFVKFTGNIIYDPIIAIVVAVIIFIAGCKICEKSTISLLDGALSDDEIAQIQSIIDEYVGNQAISLKHLRTRKAGMKKNIVITLIVDKAMHISTSHELCDEIEEKIENELKNTDVIIHLEPSV